MEKQVLVILLVVLAALNVGSLLDVPTSFVELQGRQFSVDIADSAKERSKGLMFVDDLCVDCGMLFVFPVEQKLSFWMKDTLIPLDIIFIAADKTVIDIHRAEPCTEEPCMIYDSSKDAKYAFEVNAGTFDDSIIGEVAKVTI